MKLLIIMGPTGVGKSMLAMELAEYLSQPLFYFEPTVMYQELNIGSAKPSQEDRDRVTHFGIDVTTLAKPLTLADLYHEVVPAMVAQMQATGMAVVVTGSGFFLRALLEGVPRLHERKRGFVSKETIFFQITKTPYPQTGKTPRSDLVECCYDELKQVWPARASVVHPHDCYRILRSLEVARNFFASMPHLVHEQKIEAMGLVSLLPSKVEPRIFGVFQDEGVYIRRLYDRIQQMVARGWIEEVRSLKEAGWPLKGALKSVGYREIYEYLNDDLELQGKETLSDRLFLAHRRLSKKQMRWFSRYDNAIWVYGSRFSVGDQVRFVVSNMG